MQIPSHYMIHLSVNPALEHSVTDWLLEQSSVAGFLSVPAAGHWESDQVMTTAEKVAGRRKQVLFRFHTPTERVDQMIGQIKDRFSGSGAHYWVVPLYCTGHLT